MNTLYTSPGGLPQKPRGVLREAWAHARCMYVCIYACMYACMNVCVNMGYGMNNRDPKAPMDGNANN